MCRRADANAKIVTIFNMLLAIVISSAVGGVLGIFGLPYWLVGGSVATTAVVSEHYLTLYPLAILKYIQFPIEENN